jgi:multiple sugar transport system permease protein
MKPMRRSTFKWRHWEGYLFILPWMIGFVLFALGPLIASGQYSMVQWDMLSDPEFVGLENYHALFANPDFWHALKRSGLYALLAVPLTMAGSLGVAMLLNQKVPGITVFRTVYYLPAVTSGVAMLTLWRLLFRPDTGAVDWLLQRSWIPWVSIRDGFQFHFIPLMAESPGWLSEPSWALQTMVLLSVWGLGGGMIIYLAGLQGIPDHLYEAADLDGAGSFRKFLNVTLPMLTPTIFFNLVMNTIATLQAFDQAYILSNGTGAPAKALLLYVLMLYNEAFLYLKIGSASAMAWVLFFIILVLTGLNFLFGKRWVHYE